MLLSEVSFVLTESILTNIDGHFECFSFKGQQNYAYLAACLSYGSQAIFPPEEIFLLAHNSGLIVNPKGS